MLPGETMEEPEELKIVRDERALVANTIRNQANSRRALITISTPESGTVSTTLHWDEAYELWGWLGSWLRGRDTSEPYQAIPHRLADEEKVPPPRFVFTAKGPLRLTHVGIDAQIPVEPPVDLTAGEAVELWWVIEAGECRYEHAGSPRRRS